jgi:hypothetical protein
MCSVLTESNQPCFANLSRFSIKLIKISLRLFGFVVCLRSAAQKTALFIIILSHKSFNWLVDHKSVQPKYNSTFFFVIL